MTRRFLSIAALLAVSAPFVLADNTVTTPTAPTAADLVAREVARWTLLLTLTSDQQARATTIFTTEQTALTALQISMQTAQTDLQAAVKANNAGTISSTATAIGNLKAKEVLAEATADAAFYAILTTDQKTKYDTYQTAGMGGGPGGGGGGHR
jgi:Spy/CpxP family protein refolding chaperone